MDPSPDAGSVPLECGQPFTLPPPGRLTLAGRFPAAVPAGAPTVAGTVRVTSQAAVQGVGPPGADVFLVQDGLVVTVPAAQDSIGVLWELGAGEEKSLPGEAVLTSCDPAGVGAGTYEVFARVTFAPDGSAGEVSFGGPWPLEVR